MELNEFRPQTAATTFAFSSVCFFFNDGEVSTIQCGAYTVCYQLAPRLSWPHFCLLISIKKDHLSVQHSSLPASPSKLCILNVFKI